MDRNNKEDDCSDVDGDGGKKRTTLGQNPPQNDAKNDNFRSAFAPLLGVHSWCIRGAFGVHSPFRAPRTSPFIVVLA